MKLLPFFHYHSLFSCQYDIILQVSVEQSKFWYLRIIKLMYMFITYLYTVKDKT